MPTRQNRARKSTVAASSVLSGVAILFAVPAAALLTVPAAQAAPVAQVPAPFENPEWWINRHRPMGSGLIGGSGLSAGSLDPFFDIAGLIPVLNVFIGNGADGTLASPNGGNAGLFAGNGGNGYSPLLGTGLSGGNGGKAGLFIGDGGNGGNGAGGASGVNSTASTTAANGAAANAQAIPRLP